MFHYYLLNHKGCVMLLYFKDEYDLKAYEKAMEEYKKNPVTYSLDEVKKELGL